MALRYAGVRISAATPGNWVGCGEEFYRMPRFIDTRGQPSLAIAICDRCKMKMRIGELSADRDVPGLRVCQYCNDERDPYKLPPRKTEDITVRYPRPEEPLES